jgi:hypothetical protein
LVTKKGFNEFYNRFKPSDEEMSANDMSYDEDKKIITYNVFSMDEDGGSYNSTRHKFIDFILGVLKREASKSLLLVKAKFEVSGTHDEFSFYLKRNINYLKTIVGEPSEIEEEYFKLIKEHLNKLIKNLKQEYKSYLIVSKGGNEKAQCFFKLKGDKSELKDKALNLHDSLCLNGFVKEDSKEMFVDLFTGKPILEKITWKKPKNHLKLFVDLLINKGLIEGTIKLKGSSTSAYFKLKNGGVVGDDLFSDSKVPKDPTILTDIISQV